MIKGFFFDLDGTLVDTHEANYQAYKKALADFDVTIDFEAFKATIGKQARAFLPLLAPSLKPDVYDDISHRKAVYYKDVLHVSKLNERLVGFLRLVAPDYPTVLVTTAKRQNAEAVLAYHGLAGDFDHIITAEDVTNSKPSPEAYLLALGKVGLQAHEGLAFEDSVSGRTAAEAAGMPVVMITDFVL